MARKTKKTRNYELRVTRTVVESYIDLIVSAPNAAAAARKAVKLTRANQEVWLGPLETEAAFEVSDIEQLGFQPDCEVL